MKGLRWLVRAQADPEIQASVQGERLPRLLHRFFTRMCQELNQPKLAAVFLDPIETVFHGSPARSDVTMAPAAPHSLDALRLLDSHGFAIVFISDEPRIANGQMSLAQLVVKRKAFTRRMNRALVAVAGHYVCPHEGETGFVCGCKRPADGLFRSAIRELTVDARTSWWIGRNLVGMLAAQRAGVRTALIDQQFGPLYQSLPYPNLYARSFHEAASKVSVACEVSLEQRPMHLFDSDI